MTEANDSFTVHGEPVTSPARRLAVRRPTWRTREEAEAGRPLRDDLGTWHVVLEATSSSGDAVLAGGARPFDAVGRGRDAGGVTAVVTSAGVSPDSAREREFFRRFMHVARSIRRAPGHLAGLLQVPDDGAVLTFSVWEDQRSARDWAYGQPAHAAAVARTRTHQLVTASGSLRCAVLSSSGTLRDLGDPLDRRRSPHRYAAHA